MAIICQAAALHLQSYALSERDNSPAEALMEIWVDACAGMSGPELKGIAEEVKRALGGILVPCLFSQLREISPKNSESSLPSAQRSCGPPILKWRER